jgi:hypothetical protein
MVQIQLFRNKLFSVRITLVKPKHRSKPSDEIGQKLRSKKKTERMLKKKAFKNETSSEIHI